MISLVVGLSKIVPVPVEAFLPEVAAISRKVSSASAPPLTSVCTVTVTVLVPPATVPGKLYEARLGVAVKSLPLVAVALTAMNVTGPDGPAPL
jgi:hypothetical protein